MKGFSIFARRRLARLGVDSVCWPGLFEAALERPCFSRLDDSDRRRLSELCLTFLSRKQLEPVGGLGLDAPSAVLIAALACLPVLRMGLAPYRSVRTFILTPTSYRMEDEVADDAGVVHELSYDAAGEVLELGSVVLAMDDVDEAGFGTGYNVVAHEMAHVLDRGSGSYDGMPILPPHIPREEWHEVFSASYRRFLRLASRRKTARRLRIDSYAAESPEEFFAVTSEVYVDAPDLLREALPEVFGLLHRYYRLPVDGPDAAL